MTPRPSGRDRGHSAVPDGIVTTFRVVAITEEASADHQDEVLTADSPLGRALAGRCAGDTITDSVPDGEAQAQVIAVQPPTTSTGEECARAQSEGMQRKLSIPPIVQVGGSVSASMIVGAGLVATHSAWRHRARNRI